MITNEESLMFCMEMAKAADVVLILPQSVVAMIARYSMSALAIGVPGASAVLDTLQLRSDSISRTFPLPGASNAVMMSSAADANPVSRVRTLAHELVHDGQIDRKGDVQTAVDYLGSGLLRAQAEAHAAIVGSFVHHLLTGDPVDENAQPLDAGLYHLSPEELGLAQSIWRSGTRTFMDGKVPPFVVAKGFHDALKRLLPHTIKAEAFR